MLLRLDGVSRSFGSRVLFQGVDLAVHDGDRIGLVGPNGAGKTTLLRIAAGEEPTDQGRVHKARETRIGLLRQEIDPGCETLVRDEVASVLARLDALEREITQLEEEMVRCGQAGSEVPADLAERYDRSRASFAFGGGFEREARVERVLEGLGFDADRRGRPLSSFSGGWLMRVELAKLLLAAPDLLLLDEPTNHLDLPSIQWFEETLDEYAGAIVMISHDRAFLRRQAQRIVELEGGGCTVYAGGYDRFMEQKAERREQMIARKKNQDRQIAETERFIERFRAKNTKATQVQSRIKALDKLERIEVPEDLRPKMRLRIPEPPRAGEVVLRLEDIHKSYGETRVYEGVDFQVGRGDRVALAGPNGAGKSTLLRIAAGVLPIDAGERETGHNVRVAFFAQHQLEVLEATRTVLEELGAEAETDDVPRLRGHLGAFLFSGDDVEKKVSVLSGGEKARLALAKLLLRPSNFLVLDEPTNHLDLAACEVLEQALRAYQGTMLFISHDRDFINALATRVVDVEDGVLRDFPGNYDDYRRRASRPPAPPAPEPAPPAENVASEAAPPSPKPAAALSKQERIAARQQEKDRSRRLERNRKRLAAIEEEIAGLESRVEELGWKLGDPEVYRDGEAVREIETERSGARETIDSLYREWERVAGEIESAEQVSA